MGWIFAIVVIIMFLVIIMEQEQNKKLKKDIEYHKGRVESINEVKDKALTKVSELKKELKLCKKYNETLGASCKSKEKQISDLENEVNKMYNKYSNAFNRKSMDE